MDFKKGQKVIKYLCGGGFTTQEDAVVSRINKEGVWLDNGPGNDEDGPFSEITGAAVNNWTPGFSTYIKPATE